MVKIHILGGPGSGKTTLAEEIASRFGVPHLELDTLGEKNGARGEAYLEDAFAMASQLDWVTEGVYLIYTDLLLWSADYIVLLEVSWLVAAWRMLYRHISKSLLGINPYPGIEGLKALFKLLKYARDYYANRRSFDSSVAEYTQLYLANRGEHAQPPDADRLLAHMEKYTAVMIAPTATFVRQYLEPYEQKVVLVRHKAERERLLELLARQRAAELTIRET